MSNWQYDSGGKQKDQKKYAENWERIFGSKKDKEVKTEISKENDNGSGKESS
jgi:hypothetical protein